MEFDRLDQIGGHPTTILGHPRVIDTPGGKAVEFNGKDDALFVDVHPLAGAETFTWEVVFRPDPGGAPEQRFFHLQEEASRRPLSIARSCIRSAPGITLPWCTMATSWAIVWTACRRGQEPIHPCRGLNFAKSVKHPGVDAE
ncbi:MAG TPA: hypothetical protein VGZ73_11210 [Bryobacteraceae bacterium]|nr:hypothetical protein [Bryobacteraceae bacterium]